MTNSTDGIIINRQPVQLTRPAIATIKRLYNETVISETIVERITYLSDGLHINGYVAYPKKNGRYPVLIWNRGGSGNRGALDDLTAYLILASTAVWGYVVLGTQYRGNKGSEGVEDWGGDDINDALNMIEVAKNIPDADTEFIAVEGASRGGMTTYLALTRFDKFKAAIVHAGITDVAHLCEQKEDFRKYINKLFKHIDDEDKKQELVKRSAIHLADKLPRHTPILILHGLKDSVVPVEQSELMVTKLKKLNIPHKFIRLEEGTHVALKDGTYKEIDRYRLEWLKKYMKKD